MKKINVYAFLVFSTISIISCSQNEVYENIADAQVVGDVNETSKINSFEVIEDSVIKVSNEGFESESAVLNFIEQHPNYYKPVESNSHLWQEEDTKNRLGILSIPSITVSGYDVKTQIGFSTTMFPSGLSCDSRVFPYVYYLSKKYQYKKSIQIPHNATPILPPESIMTSLAPMGITPGKTTIGYTYVLVSTGSVYDTYYLITEGNEITHNVNGQQVAPSNFPIYTPCNLRIPDNFIFKYQYSEIDW